MDTTAIAKVIRAAIDECGDSPYAQSILEGVYDTLIFGFSRCVTDVKSSTISSVGYSDSHHYMDVKFKSGAVYRYFAVPQEAFELMLGAESVGSYFSKNIRDVCPFLMLDVQAGSSTVDEAARKVEELSKQYQDNVQSIVAASLVEASSRAGR